MSMMVNHKSVPVTGGMPDTAGMNYFEADKNVSFVLKRYVSPTDYEKIRRHLSELGGIAGGELDRLSRMADKHIPELIHYNAKGERIDEVQYHASYKEMERIGYGQFGLVAMSHRSGVFDWPTKLPHVLKYAFWYLFVQAEFGLCCPMSMTDSAARVLEKYASSEIQQQYLPHLIATNMDELWTAGQFMTEKQGGSDVGANQVIAKKNGQEWEIWGDKWFCSNVSADVILVLARPEGAPAGTKGLGMFLVPRRRSDGSLNQYRINRLKDKLGTRDMASGEVTFEGATAFVVGEVENGFKQMMSMVNASRLSNAVRSSGMMRRSLLEALVSARGRTAFGKVIEEFPLMRDTLFELLMDSEAATSMVFFTADTYDRADAGGEDAETLLRMLIPLAKGYICKRARYVTAESMEVRGGNGYIEDWINPRLVRDAHLGSIWEGTTNMMALDILRAIDKKGADKIFFEDIYRRMSDLRDPAVQRVSEIMKRITEILEEETHHVMSLGSHAREFYAKILMNRMYHVLVSSLLVQEAQVQLSEDGSYRKLYMALHYLNRYVLSSGISHCTLNEGLDQWFDTIVDWGCVPYEAVADLLSTTESLFQSAYQFFYH
ncbi:acyl-CoA dehydrogenase family protein [Alicyclobacillus cycloheptanicus]|uniref:Alkylation response protein AidB-like acyl-CoA dehydrogenase n=1 Tax=Alicyclobacillus cycloheptanicus TaxID=1457 RepID=A0ABT9XHX8_9BACL|nr:acyl-CoA dehydrogenase family protein [Alicyclobacillus cycloheptanicus]MDQ0189922.1 alkylation response protein AidB-like acyl-CoA dehydrogenase [Alicyclobacillus cycloheptanicus]WDM02175.1 acyl-CoA dehydrogenase family protein [Alicyclobacillus cycloheptanicus]